MSLRQAALAYLESHSVMTLATGGPDGPWAAAVFYVSRGFDLYYLSAAHTRHARNTAARPRVAATVQENYRQWGDIRGIQLEGEATPISGAERQMAITLYGEKFPAVADPAQGELQAALARVGWYRLRPRRLYFIDNSRGLGHRDEVPLDAREPARGTTQ